MADKLWNKWATAASGHKKRLISCPWVCCWCAAWAQHSSRLKCQNNVGRCVFDLTEWHLPRYPWDWVVKHCKDLLLPNPGGKKKKKMHYSWMNTWLFTAECDLGNSFRGLYQMVFVCFSHSALLPLWLSLKILSDLRCFCLHVFSLQPSSPSHLSCLFHSSPRLYPYLSLSN